MGNGIFEKKDWPFPGNGTKNKNHKKLHEALERQSVFPKDLNFRMLRKNINWWKSSISLSHLRMHSALLQKKMGDGNPPPSFTPFCLLFRQKKGGKRETNAQIAHFSRKKRESSQDVSREDGFFWESVGGSITPMWKLPRSKGNCRLGNAVVPKPNTFRAYTGKNRYTKKYQKSVGCLHLQMWIRESIYPVEFWVLLLAEMLSTLDIKFVVFFRIYEESLRRFVLVQRVHAQSF